MKENNDGAKMTSKNQQQPMAVTIKEWATRGLSDRSIAAKCGLTVDVFYDMLDMEQNGIKPLRLVLDAARAEFEAIRVLAKDEIMNDPETRKGLKYKIVREDLKTLEEWAPATRTMKVQIEKGPTEFAFEPFSAAELEHISKQSAENDNNNNSPSVDAEEENNTES